MVTPKTPALPTAVPVEGQQVPVVRASHRRLYKQAFGAFCMAFGLLAYVLGQVSAPLLALFPSLKWLPFVVVAVGAFWRGLQDIAAALHITIVTFNNAPTAPPAADTNPGDADDAQPAQP